MRIPDLVLYQSCWLRFDETYEYPDFFLFSSLPYGFACYFLATFYIPSPLSSTSHVLLCILQSFVRYFLYLVFAHSFPRSFACAYLYFITASHPLCPPFLLSSPSELTTRSPYAMAPDLFFYLAHLYTPT